MTSTFAEARRKPALSPQLLLLAVIPIHFFCFYWWSAGSYHFSGDALFYFSRQVHSMPDLIARFLSVDDLYQYRPLTYVVFSLFLFPLFGTSSTPYHLTAYLFSSVNTVLACACVYYWTGKRLRAAAIGAIFIVLNPVHFFPSFGPTFIDQWLSSFFYFGAIILIAGEFRYFEILAPIMFLLALFSKEHSVMLPAHALLMLLALDVPFRAALRKTRTLWILLAIFAAFQLFIRHGAVFAPPGTNPNLEFNVSAGRVIELAKGAKPAIFYPENYSLDAEWKIARPIRLSTLILIVVVMVIAVRRDPKLALSGVLWFVLALLPVAFLRQPPFPRHYYLGLPGLAILFACAIRSWRSMAFATAMMALVTITNVGLYARESWVALGARSTKAYLNRIGAILEQTGRSKFYVVKAGDAHFFWHVDGGAAIPNVLGRHATFRFGALKEPLDVNSWLTNNVNVVLPRDGNFTDAVAAGLFPPAADSDLCALVGKLTGTERRCSIVFRGQPVITANSNVVETPNNLPIFEVAGGLVTLSRTTIRTPALDGFDLERTARVVPESVDGVAIEIYGQQRTSFTKVFSQRLIPGERRELRYSAAPGAFDHMLIRIDPGVHADEQRDWLVWEL